MNTILFMTALFLALPQDPVPDLHPDEPAVQEMYFAGASSEDQKIVDYCLQAIDEASNAELREAMPGSLFPKRRLKRIVKRKAFIATLKQDIGDDIRWSGDEPVVGAIGDGEILDRIIQFINDGGLEKILEFILAIIEALG